MFKAIKQKNPLSDSVLWDPTKKWVIHKKGQNRRALD